MESGSFGQFIELGVPGLGRIGLAVPRNRFSGAFVGEMVSNERQVMPEFFGTSSSNPEAGVIAVLLTFPTATCCFYALGIRWRKGIDHDR